MCLVSNKKPRQVKPGLVLLGKPLGSHPTTSVLASIAALIKANFHGASSRLPCSTQRSLLLIVVIALLIVVATVAFDGSAYGDALIVVFRGEHGDAALRIVATKLAAALCWNYQWRGSRFPPMATKT